MKKVINAIWEMLFPIKNEEEQLLENRNAILRLLLNANHNKLSTVETIKLAGMVEKELDIILKDRYFNAHQEIAAIEKYRTNKNGKEENIETNS